MTNYFVAVGDERRGPFTLDQLKAKIVPLAPHTLVWHRGMNDWAAASTVAELTDVLPLATDEPPPFRQPVVPPAATVSGHWVPSWILTYAIVVTPALWVLQRIANLVELFEERDHHDFNTTVLVYLFWSLLTIVFTGLIVAGGLRLKHAPNAKPTLLTVGLGCSIGSGLLLIGLILLGIGMAMAGTKVETEADSGLDSLVSLAAGLLWLGTLAVNCVAWVRLGRLPRHSADNQRPPAV